jgi:hypothetical protein
MTNVTPTGQFLNLPRLTGDAARALVLRVGEEMTATILNMAGNQALIQTDKGARLLATVQADEPLQPGQTVLLQVVRSTPKQLTLRLASPAVNPDEPLESGRLLRSNGLSDTQANRNALEALVAEGQPIDKQTVQALRAAVSALELSAPEDFRAVAYLMARDLPVTAALVSIVRQGLSGASLVALVGELRLAAASLLEQLPEEDESADVAQLRAALQEFVTAGQGDLRNPAVLRQAIVNLASSLEAVLLREPGSESRQPVTDETAEAEGGPGEAQPGVMHGEAEHVAGSADVAGDPSPPASQVAAPDETPQLVMSRNLAHDDLPPPGAQDTPSGSRLGPPAAPANASDMGGPAEAPAQQAEVMPSQARTLVPDNELRAGAQDWPSPSAPQTAIARGASPTPPAPDAHLAARQLLPLLDRAIDSGSLPDAVRDAAVALRDRAQQFVNGVQFQHIQNGLPPASGGPEYLSFPLPLLAGQQASQGELRLYVHDQTGSRRIDPEDVRIVMKLYLTRLQHLTINVHVLRRTIMCHIDSENPAVDRLIRAAAPELRAQLQGLGYSVAPITCSHLQDGLPAGPAPAAPKLSGVNVQA